MKGVLNVLTAFLILVFVIFSASLGSISLSGVDFRLGPIRESEITINNEISSMRHALDAAGIYLDTALRFSVYQAMHDTGKNGGMPVIPEYRKATFSGRDYAVWYSTGLDISPSEEEILNGLVGLAKQSMDKYTSDDYAFLDEFAVTLPSYSSIDIRRADNGLTASADDAGTVIFIERKSGSSTVRLEKNPKISEDFDVDYSGLYKKSKETGRSVSDRLSDILNSKLAPLPGQPEPVAPEVTCGDKFSDLTGRNTDLAAQEIMDAVSNSPDLIFERQEGNFYIKSELLQNEISIDQKMEGASQPVCTYKYNIKIRFFLYISPLFHFHIYSPLFINLLLAFFLSSAYSKTFQ